MLQNPRKSQNSLAEQRKGVLGVVVDELICVNLAYAEFVLEN